MTNFHLVLLVGVNAIWGFNFIAGKIGTVAFGPWLFTSLRFAIVLILLGAFIRPVPGQMIRIFAIAVSMGMLHYGIVFYSIYLAGSVSSVAIATQLTVPFSTILAIVFLNERVGWTRALAIVISFAGVVLIAYEPVDDTHVLALGLAVIGSVCIAIATILMRQLKGVGVFNLQAWIALYTTIVIGLLTWIIERPDLSTLQAIPLQQFWTPIYSGVGATIMGHGLLYFLLQKYPVNHVAPFITLATLFGIIFGIFFLDEQLTFKIIAGGCLTLTGVTIVAIRNSA